VSRVLVVALTLLAGGLGASLRALAVRRSPRAGTALVNVVGTVVLALVLALYGRGVLASGAAVVLGVGLSGSLTTFSGWMAVIAEGLAVRPAVTLLVDLLFPLALAVGGTVVVFAALG